MRLSLIGKKIETIMLFRRKVITSCKLKVENYQLRLLEIFKYRHLRVMIIENRTCDTNMKTRIGQAKQTFQKMKHTLTNIQEYLETVIEKPTSTANMALFEGQPRQLLSHCANEIIMYIFHIFLETHQLRLSFFYDAHVWTFKNSLITACIQLHLNLDLSRL